MTSRNYKIICDIECPISRDSNLVWAGFSEEGQLYTYDSNGLLRAVNPINN